jgi:MFS family permease
MLREGYPASVNLFLDSFWRAVAYCLHPRVIALSLIPLVVMVALALGLGYFFWAGAVDSVARWLESWDWLNLLWSWLKGYGVGGMRTVIAPLVLIIAVTPAIVIVSLLLVAAFMGPALTSLVAERRFAHLERKRGGSMTMSILWSLGSTALAAVALFVSLPLWFVPPLILVLPPLIWGWLTYRVMAFDSLAEHASKPERREVLRQHRVWLLGIGVLTGYLGAAPSIVWASGVIFAAAFMVLIPVAVWIYTLVFAFASLWFAHYCLAALEQLRADEAQKLTPPPGPAPLGLPDDPSFPAA